jgi:hypothetical protein
MIMLNQQLLGELETILKEDYGLAISQKETKELGDSLVKFFELLATIEQSPKEKGHKNAYILGTH